MGCSDFDFGADEVRLSGESQSKLSVGLFGFAQAGLAETSDRAVQVFPCRKQKSNQLASRHGSRLVSLRGYDNPPLVTYAGLRAISVA